MSQAESYVSCQNATKEAPNDPEKKSQAEEKEEDTGMKILSEADEVSKMNMNHEASNIITVIPHPRIRSGCFICRI